MTALSYKQLRDAICKIAKEEVWLSFKRDWCYADHPGHPDIDEAFWNELQTSSNWARKPSWDEIVTAHIELTPRYINKYINGAEDRSGEDGMDIPDVSGNRKPLDTPNLVDVTRRLNWVANERAGAPVDHTSFDEQVHVGRGVDHMTGIIQLAENATIAGEYMPRAIVRDAALQNVVLHTDGEARELVNLASHQKNRAESAKNLIRNRLDALVEVMQDENGGLDATATAEEKANKRREAVAEHRRVYREIDAELTAALVEVDRDLYALPDDLATLLQVLLERLEAAAMRRAKAIKTAITQQGVDLPASCADQDVALASVSRIKQLAQIDLGRVDLESTATPTPREQLLKIFNDAVDDLEEVAALNTPTWKIGGTDYPANPAADIEVTARSVEIQAIQPVMDPAIPGNVGISVATVEGVSWVQTFVPAVDPNSNKYTATLDADVTEAVRIEISGYNLCGPSKAVLVLSPAAN